VEYGGGQGVVNTVDDRQRLAGAIQDADDAGSVTPAATIHSA
jgi:hypothetical protein